MRRLDTCLLFYTHAQYLSAVLNLWGQQIDTHTHGQPLENFVANAPDLEITVYVMTI
jgi:hypothetical protein